MRSNKGELGSGSDLDALFSREEALSGLPARRAQALLFAIEQQTAHRAAEWRALVTLSGLPDGALPPQLLAEALLAEPAPDRADSTTLVVTGLGRELLPKPRVNDLERHAPDWAALVPDNPRLRAAVAHLLGQRYRLVHAAVPQVRAALGLDGEAVQLAYERLHGRPLTAIYAPRSTLIDRLRAVAAAPARWLDRLPPFWVAFALLLLLPLPQAFLALPIAAADVGPLPGLAILVLLGALNVLTVGYTAEAAARSGTIRYGNGFVGRLAADLLGGVGSLVVTLAAALLSGLALLASYVGLALTLENFTGIPSEAWTVLAFAVGLTLLSRRTLGLTIGMMLSLATVTVGLILILALLALVHVRSGNLESRPLLEADGFDPGILARMLGVGLMCFFGHLLVGQSAKVVLRRDPGGRALARGSAAGTACLTVLLAVWMVAVGGAVSPAALAGYRGTVVVPLADRIGPSAGVLGSLLVVLLLGITSLRSSLILFNLVRERLPILTHPVVSLRRDGGRLVLEPRLATNGHPRLGLRYLGLAGGRPRLAVDIQAGGELRRADTTITGRWEARELLNRFPDLPPSALRTSLTVIESDEERIHLRVASSLSLRHEEGTDGLRLADLLALPDAAWELVPWIARRGTVVPADVAARTGQDETAAGAALENLAGHGLVMRIDGAGGPRYRARFARRRARQLPEQIWRALDAAPTGAAGDVADRHHPGSIVIERVRQAALGERGRFLLTVSPMVVAFLLAIGLEWVGTVSFPALLGFTGVIAVSMFGGIMPPLLLIAGRRKGELAMPPCFRLLGRPAVAATVSLLFFANIILHGLVIWQHSAPRIGAALTGLLLLAASVAIVRAGALVTRLVVELREDAAGDGRATYSVVAGGRPAATAVRLEYPSGERHDRAPSAVVPAFGSLRSATFEVPATGARELKVWAHRVSAEGESEALPAWVEVEQGGATRRLDLGLSGGQALLPMRPGPCRVRLVMSAPGG